MKNIFIRVCFFFSYFIAIQAIAGETIQFIENKGQWNKKVLFKSNVPNGALYLESNCLTYHLWDSKKVSDLFHGTLKDRSDTFITGHAFQIVFEGSNTHAKVERHSMVKEYFNYFIGKDKTKWAGNCSAYESITYREIYPAIDLKVYAMGYSLKYDFIVHPGGDINQIKILYKGINRMEILPNQHLYVYHALGINKELQPYTYSEKQGVRQELKCRYVLNNKMIQFEVEGVSRNNTSHDIVIDPKVIFSSFSGSIADNFGSTATYDEAGNLFGSGTVFGPQYPVTLGAYKTTPSASIGFNNPDIAITKFSSDGSTRIYSTYLGGNGCDQPHSLICDKNDRLLVFGSTSSLDYPVTSGAYDTTFNGGTAFTVNGLGTNYANGADIVVTKFNASGSALIGSTYLGGSATDGVNTNASLTHNYGDQMRGEILLDTSDNVYIVSATTSSNFPTTTGCIDPTFNGGYDGIITKFNSTLTKILFSTFIGGSGEDAIYSIALDKDDVPVVAGGTTSTNFPVTSNGFDPTFNGVVDGFIIKLKPTGDSLISSTYYGTPQYDQIYFVELTRRDTIFVLGQTKNTTGFFVSNVTYSNPNSGQFISKFTTLPNVRKMSTTIGRSDGDPDISPTAFLVDFCGKIYVAGWGSFLGGFNQSPLTVSGLTVTPGAFQTTTTGNDFYLMILDDNISKLDYATYYGGNNSQEHVDGGTSRFDKNGIMYHAVCAGCGGNSDFPIVPPNGPIVSKTNNSSNCNLGVFKFDFGLPVKADFSANTGCAPTAITFTNLSHTVDSNAKFEWNFGDGSPISNAKNPVHVYNTFGVFSVRLILIDTLSCNSRDTIYKNVIVLKNGNNTTLPDKVICPGGIVRIGIDNVKDPAITFRWVPTIGLDDTTILTPYASPPVTTTYKLYISKNGCTDTFSQRVVYKLPDNIKINADTLTCLNYNLPISATLFPKATYQWLPNNVIVSNSGNNAVAKIIANNTKINLIYRDSIGCVQFDSIVIKTLNDSIRLIADTLTCKNANTTLACISHPPGVTFQWRPASLLISANGNTAVMKVDTPRFLYMDAIDNSGCIIRDSAFVNTIENKIKISADTLICKNDTFNLNITGNPTLSYIWGPANKIISGGNTISPKISISNDQWFTVTITDNSGCSVKDSVKIRVINNFFKITADTIVCPLDTIQPIGTFHPEFTYQWAPSSWVVSGGNTNNPLIRIPFSNYIHVTVTDNSGCKFRDSILIRTINYNFKITGDSIVCMGDTTIISATNNPLLTLSWRPVSKIIGTNNTNVIKVKVDSTSIFYVDMMDATGCKMTDSFRVITLENSFRINNMDTLLCLGDTFTVKAPGDKDLTYQWSPANLILSGNNTNEPRIVIDTTKRIFMRVTDTSGCSAWDTFNFTPIQYILKVTVDSTLCDGDTLYPVATNNAQFKYQWFPASMVINGAGTFSPTFKIKNTNIIWLKLTDNSGCELSDTIPLQVRSRKLSFDADTFICPNDTIQVSVNNFAGATYFWTPTANVVSGGTTPQATLTVSVDTKFNVQIKDTTYCNLTDSVLIRVISNENLNFLNQDTTWCKGDTIRLFVSEISGVTYNWNPPNVIIKDFNTAHPLAKFNGRTRIEVAVRDNKKGCIAADTIYINVNNDSVKIKAKPQVCIYDTTVLTVNKINNALYAWTPGWLTNLDTLVRYKQVKDQTFVVTALILPDGECKYTDSIPIAVKDDLVDLMVTADKNNINLGDTVQLNAKSIKAITYRWENDKTLSDLNIANPKAVPDTVKTYFVTATDLYNCIKKAAITIEINYEVCDEPEVFIPNIFSPNGDGKNDVFIIRGDNIMDAHMEIYDRWGQKMFESNNKNIGWDGTYGGTILEPAVFAFYVTVRCIGGKTFTKKGNVTLVK